MTLLLCTVLIEREVMASGTLRSERGVQPALHRRLAPRHPWERGILRPLTRQRMRLASCTHGRDSRRALGAVP